MKNGMSLRIPASLLLATALIGAPPARAVRPGQAPEGRPTTAVKAKLRGVINHILGLKDAYIVYAPADDTLQISAQGGVLSYGDGWDRVRVKPYLYHLRHRSWTNHFWKVNTSRQELYLVWGGAFGRIGSGPGPSRELPGPADAPAWVRVGIATLSCVNEKRPRGLSLCAMPSAPLPRGG